MFGLVRLFLIWLLVLSLPRLYGRSHTIRTFVVLSLTTPALSERGAGPHPSLHTAVVRRTEPPHCRYRDILEAWCRAAATPR